MPLGSLREGPRGRGGWGKKLLQGLDHSLRDRGSDEVDVFYFRDPGPKTPREGTVGALAAAGQAGKALYVGSSNF